MGNGRAAVGAEEAVDSLARGSGAGPLLDWAVDGKLVLGDDDNEGCIRQC